MFTGLIEAIGRIQQRQQLDDKTVRLEVATDTLDLTGVQLGASLAVNGVCLTVIRLSDAFFEADVSAETLERTSLGQMVVGDRVNLEQAMLPSTRFGGHIVSGHVDAVGTVASLEPVGLSLCCQIQAPERLARYLAEKGSVAVDGVSLTINSLDKALFSLNIVPHTARHTIVSDYVVGTRVNLEVDILARYLERLLHSSSQSPALESVQQSAGNNL
ncbi:MAG: riboflavin synthase [Kistimonas sp.]|nr:riboflavin synthase [Kistimonas sp.]